MSGTELLTAVTIGYKVASRAGMALHARYAPHYHASGSWAAIGAAAAGAKILRIPAEQLEDVKKVRPDVLVMNNPYRSYAFLNMFPGLDVVSTWTYTNNDPKLMLYIETLRAATRTTGQIPMQAVTMLNYPGTLAPRSVTGESSTSQWFASNPNHAGWVLMGPDRCKEVSWSILSRAPRIIGYYYSSACNPQRYNQPQDQFRVPHAASDAIKEMADRVYQPFGKLISRLEVKPR